MTWTDSSLFHNSSDFFLDDASLLFKYSAFCRHWRRLTSCYVVPSSGWGRPLALPPRSTLTALPRWQSNCSLLLTSLRWRLSLAWSCSLSHHYAGFLPANEWTSVAFSSTWLTRDGGSACRIYSTASPGRPAPLAVQHIPPRTIACMSMFEWTSECCWVSDKSLES